MTIEGTPFLIFYLAAGMLFFVRGRWLRVLILLAAPLIGMLDLSRLEYGFTQEVSLFGYDLVITRSDRLSWLFGLLFHLVAFLGGVFSLHHKDRLQDVASLAYAGSAIGAVFAGDFITFLIFCEIMAITSVFLVAAGGSIASHGAAMRYLVFHVFSGTLLFSGTVLHVYDTASTTFGHIELGSLASWCILLALGIKGAFPLLHNWVTDAYPESSPTGTVFLSALTTKVAVYALARGYPGEDLLIHIGTIMAVFPVFYALIENNLRRVLSYSVINQVGFMVCGIGTGNALGMNGAVAHAFNDVIFKALLFMSLGAVLLRTGKTNASDLGGLYRSMPWTAGFCLVGAASLSALPLFSGFVSKSMVLLAVLEDHHTVVWLALLFAAAGVLHYVGIKVPCLTFFAHDSGIRCQEAPLNMLWAMGMAAGICIMNGMYPWLLYDHLPYPVSYDPYSAWHILAQCQLLLFSGLAFCALNLWGVYPPALPGANIDADWVYRKAIPGVARIIVSRARRAREYVSEIVKIELRRLLAFQTSIGSVVVRSWPTGVMVFGAVILLGTCIVLYILL